MFHFLSIQLVLGLFLSTTFMSFAASAETVNFTARELSAVTTLFKPESTTLTFHGRTGTFTPAPSFRYIGMETTQFDIDLSFILGLLDLRFDHVVGRNLEMKFAPSSLEIQMAFDDRRGAVRSHLGRIDTRNVKMVAVLDWKERSGGRRELDLKVMRFSGVLTGQGIMGTRPVLNRTKMLAMRLFANQIKRVLGTAEVQDSIREGLSQWAQVTLGNRKVSADPTTFAFIDKGFEGALTFETISE